MSDSDFHQFKLRMPASLFKRLEGESKQNSRSVSAEILHRLDKSFVRSVDDERVKDVVTGLRNSLVHSLQDAEIAKAGALTSATLVADMLRRRYGDQMPEEARQLYDANIKMVSVYKEAVLRSTDEGVRRAAEILEMDDKEAIELAEIKPKTKNAKAKKTTE